jgi:hypothetical protein
VNEKERFEAVLRGEMPDRVPWVARMALWYTYHKPKGSLPEKYRDWELWDIQRDLGVGIMGRTRLYRKSMNGVEVRSHVDGSEAVTEYVTPVGTVTTKHTIRQDLAVEVETGEIRTGEVGFTRYDYMYPAEHMIKGPDDYRVVEYIIENTEVIPAYEDYLSVAERVGNDGVALALTDRVPIQDVILHFIGLDRVFFELYDRPAQVEQLLRVLTDFHREKIWPVCLDAPATFIEAGANLSGMVTSPTLFERYFAPYCRQFSEALHSRGKLLGTHFDGEPAPLLKLVPESGLDVVEAFTPAPMTAATVGEARSVFGDDVIIWGGIPSNILCPVAMDEERFEAQLEGIFGEIAPGRNFILGVGDNVMPEASLDRVRKVREAVERLGRLPIS